MNSIQKIGAAIDSHTLARVERKAVRCAAAIVKAVFLFGFCFVIVYPVATMLLSAFMDHHDLYDNSVALIPKTWTLDNFKAAAMALKYGAALRNTLVITVLTTVVQVFSCILAGYGFARHEFKGKNILFALVLFTVIVPPQIFNIPYYLQFYSFDFFGIMKALGGTPPNILNTPIPFVLLGITCMGIKNGIFIYLFRQSFKNMPNELEEAGTIDGANSFQVFIRIMVPNIITMLVTVILFSIVWQYNDVTYTRIFFGNQPSFSRPYPALYTMTSEMNALLGFSDMDIRASLYGSLLKAAGTLLIMGPVLIFYFITQKFFVDGVSRSGIVG